MSGSEQAFNPDALAAALADPERLQAVCKVHEITPASTAAFNRLTSLTARVLDVPSAAITLVFDDHQTFLSEYSDGQQIVNRPPVSLRASFCQHTVVAREPIVVEDAREHPALKHNDSVADGVAAYAGVPLIDDDGAAIGALCAHDSRPRHWTSHDIAVLTDLASGVLTEIALREDIVRRRAAERALKESEAGFRAIFEHSGEAIVIASLDANSRIMRVNPAFCELLGYAESDVIDMPARRLIDRGDLKKLRRRWADTPSGSLSEDTRVLRSDGSVRWASLSISRLPAAGADRQLVVLVRDVDERKRTEQRLAHEAMHDALTGLSNRRAFELEFERVLAHARRQHERAAVVLLDLDHFKAVNDTHGHAAGDEMLQCASEAMLDRLRGTDLLARIGGDEFAVILHHVDPAAVDAVAEDLRAAVAVAGADQGVTASVGVTVIELGSTASSEKLLAVADAALYASKEAGRNRVTVRDVDRAPVIP